jgi:outer membrane receptor protein involved in Fe transport
MHAQFTLRSILLGLLFTFTFAFPSFAQNENALITINGTITDEITGEPISFATVRLVGQDRGAYSNETGKYSINAKPADTLYLEFAYATYTRQVISIARPKPGSTLNNVDAKMSEKEGQVQIISAAKVEQNVDAVSISTTTLNTKQVDIQAATDISAAVNQTSGVTIYDREVSIRGSSGYTYGAGSRVLTLLDGLPMISANRSSASFDLLPTDNIAQVEIIKGASSVLYGTGAMGGVINVITAEPSTKPKTVFRAKLKVFDNPSNRAADWDGNSTSFSPSLHGFHSRKFVFKNDKGSFDLSAQVDLIRNAPYIREEFSTRGRVLIMTKAHINVLGRTIDNDGNESRSIKGTVSFGLNFQASYDEGSAMLAWASYPKGALQGGPGFISGQKLGRYMFDPHISYVTANGDRHIYRGRFLYITDAISTGQTGTSYLNYHEYQYVKTLGRNRNITLIAGANYFGNWVNYRSTFGTPYGHQFAAFLQAELKFWKAKNADPNAPVDYRLNISLGARYQFEQVTGKDDFTDVTSKERTRTTMNEPVFRGGINLRIDEITKGTFLRASIGQALRSPSITERFTNTSAGGLNVLPNPGIRLERGFSVEVGLRQLFQFGKGKRYNVQGMVDIAGFSQQYWNIVEFLADVRAFQSGTFGFSAINIARASISGVEVSTELGGRLGVIEYGFGLGFTYINPINPKGSKELDGRDTSYFLALGTLSLPQNPNPLGVIQSTRTERALRVNDQTYTLKYRNEWLVRASFTFGAKGVSLTTNWRYASEIKNYDHLFLNISGLNEYPKFRERNGYRVGFHIVDLILAYNFKTGIKTKFNHTISAHIFNVGNTEYILIPGRLGEQRSFAVQYKLDF